MVAYGEEGLRTGVSNSAFFSNNTFTSSGVNGAIAIYDPPCVPIQLGQGNTFTGIATTVSPAQCAVSQPSALQQAAQ